MLTKIETLNILLGDTIKCEIPAISKAKTCIKGGLSHQHTPLCLQAAKRSQPSVNDSPAYTLSLILWCNGNRAKNIPILRSV